MEDVSNMCDQLRTMIDVMERYQLEKECVRISTVYKLIDSHILEGFQWLRVINEWDAVGRLGMVSVLSDIVMYGVECYDLYVEMHIGGYRRSIPHRGVDPELLRLENAIIEVTVLLRRVSPGGHEILRHTDRVRRASKQAIENEKILAFMMGGNQRLAGPNSRIVGEMTEDVMGHVTKHLRQED